LKNLTKLFLASNDFDFIHKSFLKLKPQLLEFSLEWVKYSRIAKSNIIFGEELNQFFTVFEKIVLQTPKDYLELSDVFIQNPIQPQYRTPFLRNMMHIAVMNEDYAFLRYLVTKFPSLMDEIDKDYLTPLSISIELEKYICSKILIHAKSNPNVGGGNKYKSNLIMAILKL
jgi:hypothetical protein